MTTSQLVGLTMLALSLAPQLALPEEPSREPSTADEAFRTFEKRVRAHAAWVGLHESCTRLGGRIGLSARH